MKHELAITKTEIQSTMSELGMGAKTAHHHNCTNNDVMECPLCGWVLDLCTDPEAGPEFKRVLAAVSNEIDPLALLIAGALMPESTIALGLLFLLGLKIGRKQGMQEQMKATNVTK